jgi:hypothetical protein
VAEISRRVRRPRPGRWVPALAMTFVLGLVLTACGFNVQTNLPYTPADGVNLEVGPVQVRNLMILSRTEGVGFVSATMSSSQSDALVGVSGTVINSDGSNGAALTATMPNPIALGNGTPVVLTDQPAFITVKADGLKAGLTVDLTLQFSSAGETTLRVPVVDGNHPYYATVSPAPSATPST